MSNHEYNPNEKMSNFCPLPWIQLDINSDQQYRPCSIFKEKASLRQNHYYYDENHVPSDDKHTTIESILNGDLMRQTRLQMINNETPHSCSRCFYQEHLGLKSKRLKEIKKWRDKVNTQNLINNTKRDGQIPITNLKSLKISLSKKCNYQCIMCGPQNSSKWEANWDSFNEMTSNKKLSSLIYWKKDKRNTEDLQNNKKFLNSLYNVIPNLGEIFFTGGEVALNKQHLELLNIILKNNSTKNLKLSYLLGGETIPSSFFKAWEKFESVNLFLSIDGFEATNEYIRPPSNWPQTKKQLDELDNSATNINVSTSTTIQAINIYNFPDLVKWLILSKYKKINKLENNEFIPPPFNLLSKPDHLNIKNLTFKI